MIKFLKNIFYKKYKCDININTMVKFDYDNIPKQYYISVVYLPFMKFIC